MIALLFHPEIGDTPGSAFMMWLLFAGVVLAVVAGVYLLIKLLRAAVKRGTRG